MTTALNLITSAMRKAGILTKSEVPSSDEAMDGLEMLNDMIASWSNESMMVYARTLESFPYITAGVSEYTIGPSQTLNTTVPVFVVSAYLRQDTFDYPLDLITDENFGDIQTKSAQGRPFFMNYTNGYPTGKVKLYPTPDTSYTLYMLMEKQLTGFAALNTSVDLPAGWKRALIYNLGIEMAPEYGQPVSAEHVKIANDSKRAISAAVMRNRTMDANPLVGTVPNIYTGWFR